MQYNGFNISPIVLATNLQLQVLPHYFLSSATAIPSFGEAAAALRPTASSMNINLLLGILSAGAMPHPPSPALMAPSQLLHRP
jgi:hypothetical protein